MVIPLELVKTDKERCGTVLYLCANLCRSLSILLYPYLPNSCKKLWIDGNKLAMIPEIIKTMLFLQTHENNYPKWLNYNELIK